MSNGPYIKSLEDLSQLNVEKILSLIRDIDDKLQLTNNPEITIGIKSNYDSELINNNFIDDKEYSRSREESLEFLLLQRIITKYQTIYEEGEKYYGKVLGIDAIERYKIRVLEFKIVVDIKKFKGFKKEVEKLHKRKFTENNSNNLEEFDLPEGTKWEDIKIRFIDGHTVDISVHDKNYNKTYRELGFEDRRNHLPNEQWKLLLLFANEGGTISWEDKKANIIIKQHKHLLSKKLTEIFKIADDPFNPYSTDMGYHIKITLIPEN